MTTPELDKKAEEYANRKFPGGMYSSSDKGFFWSKCYEDFSNGYTQCLQDNEYLRAENARISEEHNKLTTKHLELQRKYDDLYEKRK